ncbi:MAG: hypothetical protein ACREAJ_01680, partial [Nitrosopumilaceae archaeon]
IFLILIGLSGMMLLIDTALAENPPLILSKVELWGPSSFIVNNVKSCFDNTVGQLGPWAVGWIEIQNIKGKTITAEDITLRVGSVHGTIPITLQANESCVFQTEDQITTRIGPGGSEGNGPPHGHDGSVVGFEYFVEENGKKIHYIDTTPKLNDTFGDTRIWQLVDGNWLFKEGTLHSESMQVSYLPPLKQFKSGVLWFDVKCKTGLELVVKTSGHPKCVKPTSVEKLVARGYATTTRVSDLVNPEIYTITEDGKAFQIKYSSSGAKLTEIVNDKDANSIHVKLDGAIGGELVISIPRDLLDAKVGNEDDNFFILIDGKEYLYGEKASEDERTLTIVFPKGAHNIEIIVATLI